MLWYTLNVCIDYKNLKAKMCILQGETLKIHLNAFKMLKYIINLYTHIIALLYIQFNANCLKEFAYQEKYKF